MYIPRYLVPFVLILTGLLASGRCYGDTKVPEVNRVVNGDFEKDLSGWTTQGDVAIDTKAPIKGNGSLRIGPKTGSVQQRYKIGGLKIITFGAVLKGDLSDVEGQVTVQCLDAKGHPVMIASQPLEPKNKDQKEHYEGIYLKTHAYTTSIILSIEKTTASPGNLYADTVVLTEEKEGWKSHRPTCNLDQYMEPFWKSKTVYNETVLLLSEGGKPATGKLLFKPTHILSVQDYSLMKSFAPNKDYTVEGGSLTAIADSSIPTLKDSDFPKGDFPWLDMLGKHIVVTYTHDDVWQGPIPNFQGDHLPQTMKKLRDRSPLTIVATGDSITLGNGTSNFTGIAPYMPTWGELFARQLKSLYGDNDIRLYNTAVGGQTSYWGVATIDDAVASLDPDLVLIAFGMNDFWSLSKEEFLKNTKEMIDHVRVRRPNAEFVLIACMRFDPAYTADPTYRGNLLSYSEALKSFVGDGVAVLDLTALTEPLYAAKKPKDFLADPLHPNDFLARWYAQGLIALLDQSGKP